MTITFKATVHNFPFSPIARKFADSLTHEELDRVQEYLDACGESFTYNEIDNFFVGEQDYIRQIISHK